MRTFLKLALTAALATVALTATMGVASANRLSIDDQDFDIRWARLNFTGAGGSINVSCEVTLLGRFHSATITKTRGSLIGFIDHVSVNTPGCVGGQGIPLTEALPWHVRYDSFTGTLPRITTVRLALVGARFLITASGTTCTATTTETNPAFGTGAVSATGQITSLAASGSIPLSGPFLCSLASPGSFSGSGVVEDLAGNLLFVRLI